ncbi:hypothetical protein VTK56DRAFT_2376 [Thermocarpiscus australiensis]
MWDTFSSLCRSYASTRLLFICRNQRQSGRACGLLSNGKTSDNLLWKKKKRKSALFFIPLSYSGRRLRHISFICGLLGSPLPPFAACSVFPGRICRFSDGFGSEAFFFRIHERWQDFESWVIVDGEARLCLSSPGLLADPIRRLLGSLASYGGAETGRDRVAVGQQTALRAKFPVCVAACSYNLYKDLGGTLGREHRAAMVAPW